MTAVARLTRKLGDVIRAGHPWVFSDVIKLPTGGRTGDVVDLVDVDGSFVARGTADYDTPLSFRAWTTTEGEAVDGSMLWRRVAAAAALRRDVVPAGVTGYRVCHGENDGVPGLHCDIYEGVASLRTDGPMGRAWEQRFVDAVASVCKPTALVVRNRMVDDGAARVVFGEVPDALVFSEGARRFEVDVVAGQKTGFFLDQRENRDRVAALAAGRNVLNTFAYTGGFSVAAALAGARSVTTVDIARPAVEAAARNFVLNGLDPSAHAFVCADAFDVLGSEATRAARYDMIVLDPPSFAPRRAAAQKGAGAYRALNELALRALPVGGWLATASCSSHIRGEAFLAIVGDAARRAGRTLAVAGMFGAAADHPSRLGFPDGDYLDFVLARVQS